MKKISIFLLSCFASLSAEVINVKLSKNNNVIIDQKFVDVDKVIIPSENGYGVDCNIIKKHKETVTLSCNISNEQTIVAQPILVACYNHETKFSITEYNGDVLMLDINVSK